MAPASSTPPRFSDDDRNQRPPPNPLRAVPASKLIAANVYISEGRNKEVIDHLVRVLGGWRGRGRSDEADVNSFDFAASSSSTTATTTTAATSSAPAPSAPPRPASAALVHVFVDEPYNRTGFTIAGLSSSSSSSEEQEEEEEERGEAARNGGGGGTLPTPAPPSLSSVPAAISLLAREALRLVDWRVAGGTHPAIGVVDHVAVHSLFPDAASGSGSGSGAGSGGAEEAARAARRVARGLGQLGVPTYLYGSASVDASGANASGAAAAAAAAQQWRKLAEVRRALGYFGGAGSHPSSRGKAPERGENPDPAAAPSASTFFARFPDPLPSPDAGPATAEARKGAAAVGSVPWVMNVNVPLVSGGGEEERTGGGGEKDAQTSLASAAAAVARAVSARRGTPASEGGFALPGVEALALAHEPGVVEVACNLTDGRVAPRAVAEAVERAARRAGLAVRKRRRSKEEEEGGGAGDGGGGGDDDDSSWYVTGKGPEEVAAEAAGALGLEIVK